MVRCVAIYLVRHAHAGARGAWTGDDAQRPLSSKGWRQSRHLVDVLDGADVGCVFASPATRCIETVSLIAEARGLKVDERRELFEGQDGTAAWALALEHADEDPVLCSHGDVIPGILSRLRSAGLRTVDDHRCAKGSAWAIELDDDGRVAAATYHPPES
jgi:8-oxo-dGTP diphosphatase